MASLPIPTPQAQAQSDALSAILQQAIHQHGGWIDFATFMHMALYTPRLGYYSGGAQKFDLGGKFSQGGDFVTAPELTPLFAQTLARQVSQVLAATQGCVLELGAGTGKLAADLLLALATEHPDLTALPPQYFILEVSDYLREVQRATLQARLDAEIFSRVVWLDHLPECFTGVILGNEVLDALAVNLVHQREQGLHERGVAFNGHFFWQDKPLSQPDVLAQAQALKLPNDYLTEFCPAASGLIRSLAESLQQGVILMLDYGFGEAEYYHPQRTMGTLMCHYQHYAHSDPLVLVGLQDITAHVNFTAMAEAGVNNGLSLLGYVNQAQFLMNCGMLDLMSRVSPTDMAAYLPLAAAAQKLLSPAEMGELFKVMALGKGVHLELIGFQQGDKCHTL